MPPGCPKSAQDASKSLQEASKTAPRAPKRPPSCPKSANVAARPLQTYTSSHTLKVCGGHREASYNPPHTSGVLRRVRSKLPDYLLRITGS